MTHVYRLAVQYPPGSLEPGWAPPGWSPEEHRITSDGPDGGWDSGEFRWPRERQYLSRSGANTGAGLFREYGAEVTIERSDPVTWPSAGGGQ
jgi:hypothetical protein